MYCKVVFDVPLDRDFDYAVPPQLAARVKPGVRVTAPFGPVLSVGLVVAVSPDTDLPHHVLIKEIACVLDEKPLFGSDLFPLARFMKQTWGGPIGQILFALVPPQAYFKLLPETAAPFSLPPAPTLAALPPAQETILQTLSSRLGGGFHRVLLHGPAGSGKTELILRLAGQVLQQYGQALLTLPDVWAAQHMAERLQARFGAGCVLGWHSKMLLSQKKKIFSHISAGQPCLVVSARSGGLLPFKNLRLAAMLEEENEHYKQEENKPYFHLRDLLQYRCSQHEALFITASDTPSLESLYAARRQQAEEITLPGPGRRPRIEVTPKKSTESALFSAPLLAAAQQNLQAGQASLFILNRRGYSNAYFCLNCGAYAKCKHCGAILAREKDESGQDRLVCKKCGHKEGLEQTCPQCQNKIFKSRGGGTQKVVTELGKLFPAARILRLDSDTLKNKDGQGHGVLEALQAGQADMVVGTRQALETALSARITLAAVLDADLELDSPDFRASEQLGQMLFKLRNRLALRPGARLIIQASSADIYPFEALQQDYVSYAQEELLARESFGYPPYVRMAKVLLKAKDATLLDAETARVMAAAAPFSTDMLGPVKTGKKTDTLKKQYVLLKTSAEKYAGLIAALDALKPSKKTDLKLMADPYDFY